MYMSLSLGTVLAWLLAYRYAILFPLTILEGPIVTIIAGFLAAGGVFNFWLVYLIAVAGDLVGDVIYYALGRWGGQGLRRWGHYVGVTAAHLERVERHFENHSGKTLLWGKLTHAIGWITLASAGLARLPIKNFLWFNLLGTLPKTMIFLLLGYFFGYNYQAIDNYFDRAVLVTLALIVIGVILYLYTTRRKGRGLA